MFFFKVASTASNLTLYVYTQKPFKYVLANPNTGVYVCVLGKQ